MIYGTCHANRIFFRDIGVAFRNLRGPLYPTVGMRTSGEIVEANFGQREFVFNIEEYVKVKKLCVFQKSHTHRHK